MSAGVALVSSLLALDTRERKDPALGWESWLLQGQQCPALWLSGEDRPPGPLLPRASACSFCKSRINRPREQRLVSDSSECGLRSHCCTLLLCLCLGQGPTHGVGTGFLSSWDGLAKLSWGQCLWVVRLKAKTHKQSIPVFWCRLVTITS